MEDALCRECRKPLPPGALKCTECSSYQDWRRYVFAWSGIFSAALALVPLWTGAYSLWKIAFPKPADVHLAIAACRPEGVVTYITNLGDLPAMLAQPRLKFMESGRWVDFDGTFPMEEDDFVSESREIDLVTLKPPAGGLFPTEPSGKCKYKVLFSVASSEDKTGGTETTCSCAQ